MYPYTMPEEPQEKAFLSEMPEPGKIVKRRLIKDKTWQWTLSNGAKVLYKYIPYDKPNICLRAVRRGGCSLFDIVDLPAAEKAGSWVLSSGAGNFSSRELDWQMKAHDIDFMPSVNLYSSQP